MSEMKCNIICMTGSQERVLKENISEQEVCKIKGAIKTIFEFMNEVDNYTMLQGNSNDFLQYTENKNIDIEKMEEFTNLNRMFMNWLNTFYVWIEYHERYHKTVFGKLKGIFYDKYPEYRITYYLRRYTTHQSCCISKTSFALTTGKISYLIPVKKILEEGDMNKQTKSDLRKIESTSSNIDSRELVQDTMKIVKEFQMSLWKEEWGAVGDALKELESYIAMDDVSSTYIVFNDEKIRPICISNPIGYLIQKMSLYSELRDLIR